MAKASKRPRTVRRAAARRDDKLDRAKEALARLSPGGAPDRPLEVASASIVEARALALSCARCGGELRLVAHEATAEGTLRQVRGRCKACGAERQVFVRVTAPRPN